MLNKQLRTFAVFLIPVFVIGGFFLTSTQTGAQDTESACAPDRLQRGWPMTDFCNSSIDDWSEIISGGPGKDGIPAINDPMMESIEAASTWLVDQSPVIAVEVDGEARAYPQALLTWHEIANDQIGDVAFSVTFCPLCNSSIVFDRTLDGQLLDFGVSGNLRKSDMVMYDRQTESWWQQFTGEGIVGEFNGVFLDIIPSQVIGFGQFAERYPDGLVMSRETGFGRNYGINPYQNYDQTSNPFLFRGEIDPRLPATERVLGAEINDESVAYAFRTLSENFVINDTVGGEAVIAFWQPGVASALGASVIDQAADIGTAALFSRMVDGEELTFSYDAATSTLTDDQTGSVWNLFGEAVEGELAGTELDQFVAAPHFWFAWAAFFPETSVFAVE